MIDTVALSIIAAAVGFFIGVKVSDWMIEKIIKRHTDKFEEDCINLIREKLND